GNRQLAEDLTADTFLRALKRIGSFTWQGRDPGAWLVTIARNLVADHFKSGRYRLEVTTGDVLDADREDRGPEGSPETAGGDHIPNVGPLAPAPFKSGRYRLEVTTGDVLDVDREDRGPEGSPETAVVDHITNVALL